ncbi:MAG: ferredoxin--NADP reductase [Patescibacteria group bacterium]
MLEYKYYIKKISQPSPDLVVFEVGDKRGLPVFSFRPGQYAMISYKNSRGEIEDKHAFSMASSPTERDLIRFGVRIQGGFTQGLTNLRENDEIIVSGPYGKFIYDEKKYSDIVLIAGGIGITPFFSALIYATDNNLPNKLSLIYSARTAGGATFYNEIKNLEKNNSNISTLFSFTDEPGIPISNNVIHQRLDANIINNFLGNILGKTFFICGPAPFMTAMVTNLTSLGVAKNQIQMEEFSMLTDQKFRSRVKNFSYALGFAVIMFALVFSLLGRPAASISTSKNTYNQTLLNKINNAASSRVSAILGAKNKAITSSSQQQATSGNAQIAPSASTVTNQPSVSSTPSPIIYTPVPAPAPTPTTRVS